MSEKLIQRKYEPYYLTVSDLEKTKMNKKGKKWKI
jgi:hypothetical protein